MTSRDDLLAHIRTKQQGGGPKPLKPLRIILEFAEPGDPAVVARTIREQLEVAVEAARLSEAHGIRGDDDGLARFIAVTVVGIEAADVVDSPFELGYALADATGALTAEPELGTDFYFVPRTGEEQLEGVDNFPPGCWVDPAGDPTAQQPHCAVKKIKAIDAWKLTPKPGGRAKGEGILVFQPDTGVADHRELEQGMIGRTLAYDFVQNRPGASDPMDYDGNPGHGTGTASVVASHGEHTIAGAAPLATLVPLRAVTSVVVFDHGRVAAAVEYARRNGASSR